VAIFVELFDQAYDSFIWGSVLEMIVWLA